MKLTAKQKKVLKALGWTAFAGATLMTAREVYLTFGPYREERRKLYMAALARAQELKRPLIVLGDPDAGIAHHVLGRDYQCGTICIDPLGCSGCESGVKAIADDPAHALSSMGVNSAVIFDGGYFAFAPDGVKLAQQMRRVAGPNVFMFDVRPFSLARAFEPKRKRTLTSNPQADGAVTWKNRWLSSEPTGAKNGTMQLLGARGLGYAPMPNAYHVERLVSPPEPVIRF